MAIRTLIVDDEPLARDRVAGLLKDQPDIECIGMCSDGPTAVAAILERSPDLVFLDVQMPRMDGFAVLQSIPLDKMPVVVFVTAFDEYALRAFEVHALDYLLKPFDRARFTETLDRVRDHLRNRAGRDIEQRLAALIQSVNPAHEYLERFVVKSDRRIFFIKTQETDWIEAYGNYLRLHTGKQSHLIRETMNSIESKLDPRKFIRIHRSSMVNIDRIKEMRPWFHGEHIVVLQDGTELTLSRGYRDRLEGLLGEREESV